MTSDPHSSTLTSDRVLDELELLATVEHAMVVEYLTVSCALGHDLEPEEGGATSPQGREAAGVAFNLAQSEMFHLSSINRVLVDAGRSAQLGRASKISTGSGGDVQLDPPTADQLRELIKREQSISSAVDWHYAQLAPAVTTKPLFEGALLDSLRGVIVDSGSRHGQGFAGLRDSLGDPVPPDFLRVPRRATSDAFEQRLLDVSDRVYGLVTSALAQRYAQQDFFAGGAFRALAVSAMDALDDSNRALAQRGLLPPFTLA
ncbi:MAG: hypothetical protein ABIW17_07880 [Marmoricola sp.]